jgi:hypothetical protein
MSSTRRDFEYLSELSTSNEFNQYLWTICEDETINWKGLAERHLVNYIPSFRYDGYLYCLSLMHSKMFNKRQLEGQEGEYSDYDEKIFKLGLLSRRYRQNLNADIIELEQRRPIYNIYSNPDDSINRDVSEAA